MVDISNFCINTYSYTLNTTALDCVNRLAEQGYKGVELMMYPGHLWPSEVDQAGRKLLKRASVRGGVEITSINMPNIDLNVAAATVEMRSYTIGLLKQFIQLAGDLEAPFIIVGPGKSNPLLAPPQEFLLGQLSSALDTLLPLAKAAGTKILLENMPFAFLPSAENLLAAVKAYGSSEIGIIYDVANGHFIGKDPVKELRLLKPYIELIHFSDTRRDVYKHDAIGLGDVAFAPVMPVLTEIDYKRLPVLEVISRNPDTDIRESAIHLAKLGYGKPAK
jgi:L-ribulose-5-phosphate 3-epimerase